MSHERYICIDVGTTAITPAVEYFFQDAAFKVFAGIIFQDASAALLNAIPIPVGVSGTIAQGSNPLIDDGKIEPSQ